MLLLLCLLLVLHDAFIEAETSGLHLVLTVFSCHAEDMGPVQLRLDSWFPPDPVPTVPVVPNSVARPSFSIAEHCKWSQIN